MLATGYMRSGRGKEKEKGGRHARLHRSQDRGDAGKLRIEIAGIRRTSDLRQEGRRDPLVVNVVPVDVPEEGVAHDLLGVGGARAESELGFSCQQLLQD